MELADMGLVELEKLQVVANIERTNALTKETEASIEIKKIEAAILKQKLNKP